ncbi:MAG: hypothetical protein RL497_2697, partial [Pseudomonadota bacterium]
KKSEWLCRKQEIRRLVEDHALGKKPIPESTTGTVSSSSISVKVSHQGKTASFSATVTMPSGTGPFPAAIVYGTTPTAAKFQAQGVAVINMNPESVATEKNKTGPFYTVHGSTHQASGVLVGWGWGVSRIIDVLEKEKAAGNNKLIDPARIAVSGCSRWGKGAFAAGVMDDRVALTVPVEPGVGGTAIWRGVPGESGAQPLTSAFTEAKWLGDVFSKYQSSPNTNPVDTHEMIGMIAPRGFLLLEQLSADWLGLTSSANGALAGAEIYKALGVPNNITQSVGPGKSHCSFDSTWDAPLTANIKRFLKGESVTTGGINQQSSKKGDKSKWVDWATPTLE